MQISLAPIQVNREAVAKGCRANYLWGIHEVHGGNQWGNQSYCWNLLSDGQSSNLSLVCSTYRSDFKKLKLLWKHRFLPSQKQLFRNHGRWNVAIYCKKWLLSWIGAEPTTWHGGLNSQANDLWSKREFKHCSLNSLGQVVILARLSLLPRSWSVS